VARPQARDSSSLVPAEPASDAGTFLGGYWLLNQLARGEFCTIHRARPIVADVQRSEVVVKRLRSAHRDGPARARLLREARVGLGVRGKNLVRVLTIHDEPELFVVMEYVEGISLRQLLARTRSVEQGSAALAYVLPMFVDTLTGLSALYNWKDEEGAPGFLVHQAPSANHMLIGIDGVTRLIDLSHVHARPLRASVPVVAGLAQAELAPEQRASRADLDPRCDIFLLGSALASALSCAGMDRDAQVYARCAPLRAIAERARNPRRSARFWSADEMAYVLQKAAIEANLYATREATGAFVRGFVRSAHERSQEVVRTMHRVPARASEGTAPRAGLPPPVPPARTSSQPLVGRRDAALPPIPQRGPSALPAPAFVAPRSSAPAGAPCAAASSAPYVVPSKSVEARGQNKLRRVAGAASAAALLIGMLALAVRGFEPTPTASASRLILEGAPAWHAQSRHWTAEGEPEPVVTSLARVVPRRARVVRAADVQPLLASAPTVEPDLIPDEASASSIGTIEASIRAVLEEEKPAVKAKNLFVRPRLLRAELPGNPY
jgi:hypothetical protein